MQFVIETKELYKDFPCVVTFNDSGFRTGYVGIPKGHNLYKVPNGSFEFKVHCGVDLSGFREFNEPELDKKKYWWYIIGYNHYGDGYDTELAQKLFKVTPPHVATLGEGRVHTTKEVLRDCKQLAYMIDANYKK